MAVALSADVAAGRVAWPVVIAAMLTALLEVLDLTVVNVSLPHMLGAFGATPDQITWVVTSYMISSAAIMPLTGYLVTNYGRRRTLLFSIGGFVVTSAACGAAWNLQSMVIFRLLQGATGAVLIPLAQSFLFEAFPREKRAQAMSIFGLSIMIAPILGPTLGGWITENFEWRWVFYINVPIGVVAFLLGMAQVPASERPAVRSTDWTGLVLLCVGIGSLQAVLDQGQTLDWFASNVISGLTFVCVVTFLVFTVRGLSRPDNIIDLKLFRDRNFALGCLLIAGYGLAMYGTITLLPLLSQRVLGYPADTAGLIFLPRGLVSAVMMVLIGSYLAGRVDVRKLIGVGVVVSAVSCLLMTEYSLDIDMWGLIWPGFVQGFGMALIFGQVSVITFDTVPPHKSDEAAGLYSVTRTIGSSMGVAISGTVLVRQEQVHTNILGGHVTAWNPALAHWLDVQHLDWTEPTTPAFLAHEIGRHATMGAFLDCYWMIAWFFMALLPMVFLLKRSVHLKARESGAH